MKASPQNLDELLIEKINKMANLDLVKFALTSTQHTATICQYVSESNCTIPDVKIICQGGASKFSHRFKLTFNFIIEKFKYNSTKAYHTL